MRLRMIQTKKGSPDGIQVNTYEQGRVYDLPNPLACIFLEQNWAEEDKALNIAPEVKADGTSNRAKTRKSTSKRTRNPKRSKTTPKD